MLNVLKMGPDFEKEDKDNVEEMMARDRGSDEVAAGLRDVPDIAKMGDDIYFSKSKVLENSTKNGQMCDVR